MTEIEGFVLGVDLGTSHTVAMLRHPDGRTRPLLFDGRPLMPSAVFLDRTGRLHVGADALRLGHAEPGRLEPNPKRRIDDGTVLLGDAETPVPELFAALLGAVAREAVATAGYLPPAVLTHPAAWGEARRAVLVEALGRAGWPQQTRLVPEPVTAARYFADVLRRPVPAGGSLAVFDFGGGTLDVAVVRNDGPGPDGRSQFSVTASGGADDLGGLDLDAALVDHLAKSLSAAEPEAWHALTDPTTLAQWRARRQFWTDVREAKEMLSRSSFAPVAIPGVEHAAHVTRDELEAVADPLVRRGVAEAREVIEAAGLKPAELSGLFLVGGSSRVPLVARLLHAELGIAPTVLEQPELPVAEGALLLPPEPTHPPQPARFAAGRAEAATPTPTPATASAMPPPITDTRADHGGTRVDHGGTRVDHSGTRVDRPVAPPISTNPTPSPRTPEELTDERLHAAPVDPWATGEAAALPTEGHYPLPEAVTPTPTPTHAPAHSPQSGPPSPQSGPPSPQSGPPGPWHPPAAPATASRAPGRRKRAYLIGIAASVTVVLAAGAVLAWVFWPGYPALDYHPLSEPRRIAPVVPVSSDWSDAAILGDRAYFASSETENGTIGVVAIDTGDKDPAWTSTSAGTATQWQSMFALPVGLALFSGMDSATSTRRMAVLGASRGNLLWERTLGTGDEVFFAGDSAIVSDRAGHQLLGLKLSDGRQRWAAPDPAGTSSLAPAVLTVTTPADLEGPATVFGRPYAPNLSDDPRIVQIGADRSARVLDADTGKVLTSRNSVADPDDEVVAHNGRLVVLQSDDKRIVSYELSKLGEPSVLYTPQEADPTVKVLTPCGDDRVCFVEQAGYDSKKSVVVSLDVAGREVAWRFPLPATDTLVPVGEAVLATTTTSEMTLIDPDGKKIWTHTGEAARLDGANLLEFSKPLSRSPSDPSLSGRHIGDDAVPLGSFLDV
ncbi:MAG: Hsp70 family protein, partial [Actinoplanes sp.]